MPYDVTLIPGDGTGPEITEATLDADEKISEVARFAESALSLA